MTHYTNEIAEMELLLEYHLNDRLFSKTDITKCLDKIIRCEKRIEKLSFYLKNNVDGGNK